MTRSRDGPPIWPRTNSLPRAPAQTKNPGLASGVLAGSTSKKRSTNDYEEI